MRGGTGEWVCCQGAAPPLCSSLARLGAHASCPPILAILAHAADHLPPQSGLCCCRESPELVYGCLFEREWRSLSQAALAVSPLASPPLASHALLWLASLFGQQHGTAGCTFVNTMPLALHGARVCAG